MAAEWSGRLILLRTPAVAASNRMEPARESSEPEGTGYQPLGGRRIVRPPNSPADCRLWRRRRPLAVDALRVRALEWSELNRGPTSKLPARHCDANKKFHRCGLLHTCRMIRTLAGFLKVQVGNASKWFIDDASSEL